MKAKLVWVIIGSIIIVVGWLIFLQSSGTCSQNANLGGFPFTGCAWMDEDRVVVVFSAILGVGMILYGFFTGRSKPIAQNNLVEKKASQHIGGQSIFSPPELHRASAR
ncbi:MAG: hypothetical protein ACRECH_00380 [Nitrososphaerales archaeon]